MKQYIIVFIAIVATVFVTRITQPEPRDWSHEWNESQRQIEANRDLYNAVTVKLDTIYSRLNQKYVEIDSANKPDLRHLFDDFKFRTK
jgi:hypothetical protein